VEKRRPNAFAIRPASVVAALTLICWPRIARTANSKPFQQPGTRKPGAALTRRARSGSLPKHRTISLESAFRSNIARIRWMIKNKERGSPN